MRSINVNLQYANPLANDYLFNFEKVAGFFTYNPYTEQSWADRYAYLTSRPKQSRDCVVKALTDYNLALGAGQDTLDNVQLLSRADAAVVVTGQQAGLLGGPLYTIYKALTAVQLARTYTARLNRPVIPVFWIAAEDHDFGEINHFHILNRQGQPTRIRLETEPQGKFSIGHLPVPAEVTTVLNELEKAAMDTEFKPIELDFAAKSAAESKNLADWFGRLLLRWLGSTGLVLVNPMDPGLRQLEASLFKQAVIHAGEVNALLDKLAQELRAKEYPIGVEKDAANINLFMYHNGERLALTKTETGYKLKGREVEFSRDELLDLIETKPEKFSPNVVLRPLTQEILFPTLAYVGGPGEVNYFSQYKEIFELFQLQMPIIYPRVNVTLVEGSVENYLHKYQLSLEDVLVNLEEKRKQLLAASDRIGIDKVFMELQEQVEVAYTKAIGVIKEIDPALDKLGRENRDRVLTQVEWLKSKTQQAHRKENDVALRQFEKLGNHLAPGGSLQERYLSGIHFVLKYGSQFYNSLNELNLLNGVAHKMVFLKG